MTPPAGPDFQRLISGSRLRLRGKSAFFATLLLHAEFVPSREVAAAGTDGERVYVNPEVAASLAPDVLDGLLLHEVLHAALSHVERRGPREKKRWNKSADLIVNGMVAAAGLPTPPQSRRDEHLERLSVEEVYTALEGEAEGDGDEDGDDLLDAPPGDAPPKQGKPGQSVARQWQQALAQARSVDAMSGGKGDDPLGMHRELMRLAPARLDWRAHLWRFLARTPVDFGGFDRRFVGRGLYLEALDDESLRALIAVDTSGSVDDDAVRALVGEVQGVLGAYPHVKATLYYADTEAYGPHDLSPGGPIPAPQGGGGTDFRPIFRLLDEHEPDVLVYLTDGYGDFPEQAPRTPTLWVVPPGGLEDEGFPFGEVLRLEEHG
ncbi:vWA domain-containing protein [Deinococcus multiflagellatus]|uniref:vWA domain-containing protein n=1 Tax=Deinococcus multiflagellatus TaxID=1656887 RepID=UPI001CCFF62F|nr:VWA-like domain-containing protein [Deinococcus multiflagellatus]MBZ9712965.1 VWA-like domain-containing protein [Deinococcus multiflagellatus]